MCNISIAASWASRQESVRRQALVGVTRMAEFVVSTYVDQNLKAGVGCLLRKWRASTANKGSLRAWGSREAKKDNRATQVGLSFT